MISNTTKEQSHLVRRIEMNMREKEIEKKESILEGNNTRITTVYQQELANRFERATTVNNESVYKSARSTTPNQNDSFHTRSTTPNQGINTEGRQTMPNQVAAQVARDTMPNRPFVQPNDLGHDIISNSETNMPKTLTGTVIEGFTVGELINNKSGEALLYKCIDSRGKEYVIKQYQRPLSEYDLDRHNEIISKLEEIPDGVVRILATGIYEGHLYEVMPYYYAGSLRDRLNKKLFSEEEIKKDILPLLLPILKSIHDKGIYHSDIKPDNIMYETEGKKDLVLIDFGISKISQGGWTTYTSDIKGTPDYQAPESFKGILHPETDYYALGITLFELMSGKTPRAYILDQKYEDETAYRDALMEVERAVFEDVIPHPDVMSDDMYRLVYYLTFDSIRNRKDRSNHNNRWIYEEVNQWLIDGNPSWSIGPIPEIDPDINIRFGGKLHTSMNELLVSMAGDWERGCDFITRPGGGLVAELAKSASRNLRLMSLSTKVKDFVDTASRSGQSADVILFVFIYQFGKEIKPIFWKGNTFRSFDELGNAVFRSLSGNNYSSNIFCELFAENLLDIYIKQNKNLSKADTEKIHHLNGISYEKDSISAMYFAAYTLMDEKRYFFENGDSILTPAALKLFLTKEGLKGNLQGFIELCKEFIHDSGNEKEGFKAWYDVNKKIGIQISDPHDEIKTLSPIQKSDTLQRESAIEGSSIESKITFSPCGLIIGLVILATTVAPFVMLLIEIISGRIGIIDEYHRYAFIIGTAVLPVIPLLLAKLICIPRNNVTNICFKTVSNVCGILKFDAIIAIVAIIYEQYSNNVIVGKVLYVIHYSYSWVLLSIRNLIGYNRTDEILNSLAARMGISQSWFNDTVRLAIVFFIYIIINCIFRKRKEEKNSN